jgi:hypothetical protein
MRIRKTIAFFQIVSIAFCNFWNLRFAIADDSDIFGYNVKPNVMLALTSSTNMGSLIRSEPYVPGTTYNTPLTYITTTVYKYLNSTPGCKPQPKPCYVVYAASIDAVADSAARTALSTVGYWSGSIAGSSVTLYYGNYLNYSVCTTCGTDQSKISIAKTVLTNLVNNTAGVRFGAEKYAAGGGLVMEEIKYDFHEQTNPGQLH